MIQQSYARRVSPMHPRLVLQRIKLAWPFAVWLGAAALCAYLYFGFVRFSHFAGVVVAHTESVAPLVTGRLVELEVALGQHVMPGDLLARMDVELIQARLAVQDARIAEEQGALAGFQQDILSVAARLDADLAAAEARGAELRLLQVRYEAEIGELRAEVERREALQARQLLDAAEVHEVRLRLAGLEAALGSLPELARLYDSHVRVARELRHDLEHAMTVDDDQTVAQAMERAQAARRAFLDAERDLLLQEAALHELRATREGIVTEVHHLPGAVVQSGEKILRLVEPRPIRVEAFLPESMRGRVQEGDAVRIVRSGSRETFAAKVAFLAPEVRTVRETGGLMPGSPLRAQRVVLHFTEGTPELLAGETVSVRPVGPIGGLLP